MSRFFSDYGPRVVRTCLGILGNIEDAQDAAQETFARAYQAMDRFDTRADFLPWIIRIATNVCRDVARRRCRHPEILIEDDSEDSDFFCGLHMRADTDSDPIRTAMRSGVIQAVREGLRLMPFDDRLILEEFHLHDERSKAQRIELLAELLNCSQRTVYYRLASAQAKLRRWLIEQGVVDK